MASIEIKDASGKKVENRDLNATVFGIEPNVHVMHNVVRMQRNAARQGTHNTLTRGQVRGGGRKPWRQKGTGHARQGTIRAPHWTGGGVVFGPHPRSYEIRMNRKEIKLAMRSALSAKLRDGQLMVVKDFGLEGLDKPSTKQAAQVLKALGAEGRTTIVVGNEDYKTYLSFRNIPTVNVFPVSQANTLELVDNKVLIFTAEALSAIEEMIA